MNLLVPTLLVSKNLETQKWQRWKVISCHKTPPLLLAGLTRGLSKNPWECISVRPKPQKPPQFSIPGSVRLGEIAPEKGNVAIPPSQKEKQGQNLASQSEVFWSRVCFQLYLARCSFLKLEALKQRKRLTDFITKQRHFYLP